MLWIFFHHVCTVCTVLCDWGCYNVAQWSQGGNEKWGWRERAEVSEWLVKLPAHSMNISLLTHSSFSAGPQETDKRQRKTDRQPPPNPITAHGQPSQTKSHTPTFPEAGLTGSILQCWQRCLPSPSRAHHYTQETLTRLTTRQPTQITCKHENCRAQTECFVCQETDASVYWKGKWVEETRRGLRHWCLIACVSGYPFLMSRRPGGVWMCVTTSECLIVM